MNRLAPHWFSIYWPVWLGVTAGTFLAVEIYALATHGLTLSSWVWQQLKIMKGESITQWSAADLLVFCTYMSIFVLWLPWHFFFRKFP